MSSVRFHLVGGAGLVDVHGDLSDPQEPARVIDVAVRSFGAVDGLVCNQASSGRDGGLEAIDAADLDHHWAVDARASLLATQAFASRFLPSRSGRLGAVEDRPALEGAVVLMTSGQGLGPMPEEIAYCTAKAALAGMLAAAWVTGQVVSTEGGFRRWD